MEWLLVICTLVPVMGGVACSQGTTVSLSHVSREQCQTVVNESKVIRLIAFCVDEKGKVIR